LVVEDITKIKLRHTIKLFENHGKPLYMNLLPSELLKALAHIWNISIDSEIFCMKLDACGMWPTFRENFEIPKLKDLPKGTSF
jgi:hypothetical protein